MHLKNSSWPKPPRPLARLPLSTGSSSPHTCHSALNHSRCWNIKPAVHRSTPFGLELRSRLTLGGRTLPRKPWVYGGQEFNLSYRYSCLHSHFLTLHGWFPSRFDALRTLPYHSDMDESQRHPELRYTAYRQSFSARNHSMSQLLRTV